MKQFIVDRHTTPNTPTLEQVPTDKIPIYASETDAEADLANLSVGQIIGITDTGDELAQPVDVVEEDNLHAVTSNAVAESLTMEKVYNYLAKVYVAKPKGIDFYIFNLHGAKVSQIGDAISSLGITTQHVQIFFLSRRDSSNNNVYPCVVVLNTDGTLEAWYASGGTEHTMNSSDILYGQFVVYKN